MTSIVDADTILVIDVGSMTTRAILFDVVDGRYRFIAKGEASTTAIAPYRNIGEGVRIAIDRLQAVTGRTLVDAAHGLIIPSSADGSGVDRFAATISAGEPLNVVVVGLLEDVSTESARKLAQTTYSRIEHAFSLNDRRKPENRLNLLLRARPDLVVAAGGTNDGASQSVISLMESVGLACYLLPESVRPDLLYVGNPSLTDEIRSSLEGITKVHFAANIRPTVETEQLEAAQTALSRLYIDIKAKKLPGVDDLIAWAGEGITPTASAFGRVVRFLSAFLSDKKGVLGLDAGASAITLVAAVQGESTQMVFPQLGLSEGVVKAVDQASIEEIQRWTTGAVSAKDIRAYLATKAIHPYTLPATIEEMDLEQAIARQAIQKAVQLARPGFSSRIPALFEGCLPHFEPILASGSVLTRAAGPAQSALLLLDSLQPVGITTLVLDQNHIAPAVGAAAIYSPLLAAQVMDSNSFLNLGTMIAPVANVKTGQPILRVKASLEGGGESITELKQGSLAVIPVPYGQSARLSLQPLHRSDIGMGAPGRGGSLTVKGGALGVILDGRGRPLVLPKDWQHRQELYKKWLWALGGQLS